MASMFAEIWSDMSGLARRIAKLERTAPRDGAPGPTGPQGEAGPAGLKGDKGERGDPGRDGLHIISSRIDGDDLAFALSDGREVLAGNVRGPQGPAGEAGPQGDVGDRGPSGEMGPKGDQGPEGKRGAPGATGPKGDTGAIGPQGKQGVPGIRGERGEKGEPGATVELVNIRAANISADRLGRISAADLLLSDGTTLTVLTVDD